MALMHSWSEEKQAHYRSTVKDDAEAKAYLAREGYAEA